MALKMLQITAPVAAEESIRKLICEQNVISFHKGALPEKDHAVFFLLTRAEHRQPILDKLRTLLHGSSRVYVNILTSAGMPSVERIAPESRMRPIENAQPVEEITPVSEVSSVQGAAPTAGMEPTIDTFGTPASDEATYPTVKQGGQMDAVYLLLTVVSAVIALIGLIQNSPSVIVGAMAIAPFLGPHRAFVFATSQGDRELMKTSARTGLMGLLITIIVSLFVGLIWNIVPETVYLTSRIVIGLGSVGVAVAAGVAIVLSVTAGLSKTLVAVMVAVALLPAAATFGLMVGLGEWQAAYSVAVLLFMNLICVHLSGLVTLIVKGSNPRIWLEQKMSKTYVIGGIGLWSILLLFMGASAS